MKLLVLFFVSYLCRGHSISPNALVRSKRDVAGALHIVNNHEQAIHEDVKPENPTEVAKVVAPQDLLFQGKSLRKSAPLVSTLELVRGTSRAVALLALLVAALLEFYPLIKRLCAAVRLMDL